MTHDITSFILIHLYRAMFWHTDDNLLNVDEVVQHAPQLLQRAASAPVPKEDYALLQTALQYV